MKPTQNDVDVAIKAAAKSTEEVKIFVTAFVKTKKRGKDKTRKERCPILKTSLSIVPKKITLRTADKIKNLKALHTRKRLASLHHNQEKQKNLNLRSARKSN